MLKLLRQNKVAWRGTKLDFHGQQRNMLLNTIEISLPNVPGGDGSAAQHVMARQCHLDRKRSCISENLHLVCPNTIQRGHNRFRQTRINSIEYSRVRAKDIDGEP